ncbi:MAG: LCP family protein [Nocardioides sp.]
MRARVPWRHLVRLALLLAVAGLLVPDAGVHRTTISLTKVESAKSVDFADGVVWLLVLGSDARPGTPLDKGNTDAIQLVGLDLQSGRAAGIGIPRDAYVDLPGDDLGMDRINAAMKRGSTQVTAAAVADLVGITPDYVFLAGFDGFTDMVDTIDGVTVDDGDKPPQDLDGAEALEYARTRLGLVGGDFERAAHQQEIMRGILDRLLEREDEEGFMERGTLSALQGMTTDLAPTELYQLAQAVTQIRPSRVSTCVLVGGSLTTPEGADVIELDPAQARDVGDDASDNLRFDRGC